MASSRLERIGTIFTRVEGLLSKGAMKPDDRPLWFDVYRAFPPISEPKYAKPKPESNPIRPILYNEDEIRVKFNAEGKGFAAVNMLTLTGETQMQRLVKQYNKLKAEGIPESELLEKSVNAVGDEHQIQIEGSKVSPHPLNPELVSAKVLSNADLKNIFKEDKDV